MSDSGILSDSSRGLSHMRGDRKLPIFDTNLSGKMPKRVFLKDKRKERYGNGKKYRDSEVV